MSQETQDPLFLLYRDVYHLVCNAHRLGYFVEDVSKENVRIVRGEGVIKTGFNFDVTSALVGINKFRL